MLRNILMTTVIASAMIGSAYAADLGYRPALRKTGSKLLITHGTRPKAAIKTLVIHRTLPLVHSTHATSAPEPGGLATLPNGKDAPAVTTSVSRDDVARSSLKGNQQNTISSVVVPDYVVELFFREGAKIIELLRATGYSDHARHEIPPEVIALEPALAMFRFVKRPEGDIGLVSGP
jgi:hypothetical protein